MHRISEFKDQIKEISRKHGFCMDDRKIEDAADILFRREDLVMCMAAFPPCSQGWWLCSEKIVKLEAELIAIEPGLIL